MGSIDSVFRNSTAKIINKNISGHGTCVLFSKDNEWYALTAFHCIAGTDFAKFDSVSKDDIEIYFRIDVNEEFKPVPVIEILIKEKNPDIALLKISPPPGIQEIPDFKFLDSSNIELIKELIRMNGYPKGFSGKKTNEIRSQIYYSDDPNLLEIEIDDSSVKDYHPEENSSGYSGSGMFIERGNQIYLVGIFKKYKSEKDDNHAAFYRCEGTILSRYKDLFKEYIEFNSINLVNQNSRIPPVIPYDKNPFFVDRSDVPLQTIENELRENKNIVLSGMGGNGKTQLASQYVNQYKENYHAVFWINAETVKELENNLANLTLKIPNIEKSYSKEDKRKKVLTWLQENQNWIIVFDNVTPKSLLALKDKYFSHLLNGFILITMQPSDSGLIKKLEIKPFQESDAIRLMQLRTEQKNLPLSAAKELCQNLGNHPLAIEQASAYIRNTGISLEDYLQVWKKKILSDKLGSDIHKQSLTKTFLLCKENLIAEKHYAAVELLYLFSFLHPDFIFQDLFMITRSNLPLLIKREIRNIGLDEIILHLKEYSLIERQGNIIRIHRMVQEVIRNDLELRLGLFKSFFLLFLSSLTSYPFFYFSIFKIFWRIFYRVQMKLNWYHKTLLLLNETFPELNEDNLNQERIKQAELLFPSTIYISEISNEEGFATKKHITVIRDSLNRKIESYLTNLEDKDKKIDELRKYVLANPDNYEWQTKLAIEYYNLGLFESSLKHLKVSLQLDGKQFDAKIYRGRIHLRYNNYSSAYKEIKQALRQNSKMFNEGNHYYILGVAAYYFGKKTLSNTDIAVQYLSKHLSKCKDSWRAYYLRARIRVEDREKAYYNETETDLKTVIDLNPDITSSYILLGKVYILQGNKDKAKNILSIGKARSKSYDKLIKFGRVEFESELYDEAISSFSDLQKEFPDNHFGYLNRAMSFIKKGNHDEAIIDLNEAQKLKNDLFICRYFLGNIQFKKGNYLEAIKYFEEYLSLNLEEKKIENLKYLGKSYLLIGEYKKSIEHFNKAIREDKTDYTLYTDRANCFEKLNMQKEAIASHKNAYTLLRRSKKQGKYLGAYYQLCFKLGKLEFYNHNIEESKKYFKSLTECPVNYSQIKTKAQEFLETNRAELDIANV